MKLLTVGFLSVATMVSLTALGETPTEWTDRMVEEAWPMSASKDQDWWLNSGAYFVIRNHIGLSVRGSLPEKDRWRRLYNENNPVDTDRGYHPQNVFRLLTRKKFLNSTETAYFRLRTFNKSQSKNRNESNGILLFSRYADSDNLYYAGLRVDGRPIIKKKVRGEYINLSYPPAIFPGTYSRDTSPNLLPMNKWLGLRCTTVNRGKKVQISLYLYVEGEGSWRLVAEALDDGISKAALLSGGHVGIRTDFFDFEVRDHSVTIP